MITVGLTGQSGAGKGEFSRIFKSFPDVYCLDTDITAREVVEKGKPCLKELCSCFGEEILNDDGTLNRRKLAEIAFSDEENHKKLNSITHFYIMQEVRDWLRDVEKAGAAVAIIDAPLLFESNADMLCDVTVGVTAPYTTRLKRIMKRDNLNKKSAVLRLDSQPSDEFFTEKCTYIIANNGSLGNLSIKSESIINDILSKFKS